MVTSGMSATAALKVAMLQMNEQYDNEKIEAFVAVKRGG
jgi:galactokinase